MAILSLFRIVAMTVAAAALVTLSSLPARPIAGAPWDALPTCAPGVQFLGFSEALDKISFGEFEVAELSGVAYDPRDDRYYAVSDRAGTARSHIFTLDLPVTGDAIGSPKILAATVLRNPTGIAYTGANFDGEGIALSPQNVLFVSSEGGPAAGQQPEIRRFSLEGNELGPVAVPPRFLIGPNNLSFESMAVSPSGHSLFTANERPLPAVGTSPADGQTSDSRNRIRILRFTDHGQEGWIASQQFFYLTEPDRARGDVGVVDLIALSEEDLLVLERGFVAGRGNTVRVFRTSTSGAQDVSGEPTLAAAGLVPLPKTLLVDLQNCPDAGATVPRGATQPNALLDNFEAMVLGPALPGGRRALLLISDDNGAAVQKTRVVALAIGATVLAGEGDTAEARPTGFVREVNVTFKAPDLMVPNTFTIIAGDTLRFRVRNEGPAPHNLHIGGNGVEVESPVWEAGTAAVWQYTFNRPGVYAIYCTVAARGEAPGTLHRHVGPMEGVVVVTGPAAGADLSSFQTRNVRLASQNGSGVSGTAHLQQRADHSIAVRIEAAGLKPGTSYLAGIYDRRSGTCGEGLMGGYGAPVIARPDGTARFLYTTKGAMEDWWSAGIREGGTAPGTLVACGDASAAVLGVGIAPPGLTAAALPRTGDTPSLWLPLVLGTAAGALSGGLLLRRRLNGRQGTAQSDKAKTP